MITVCVITKNEEKNIEKCLVSLKNTGFELIVVDTGSADQTKEIAKKYTRNIYDFTWCNDFAAAKNYAISKATYDMVMIIDSDEYLDQIDIPLLKQMIQKNSNKVGRIKRINTFEHNEQKTENREWINRVFSRKKFHYEGRIHEQVVALDGSEDYETYQVPVTILHSGYDLSEEERKKKARRNIELLDQELQELTQSVLGEIGKKDCLTKITDCMKANDLFAKKFQENSHIPYVLYQLGKSYYMAADYTKACSYFECGLCFDLNPKLEYVIDMVETYGYALLNSEQANRALFLENVYDEFGNTVDFKFLMGLIYMNNEMFDIAVEEFKKALEMSDGRVKGANSYLASYNIGVIYECLGKMSEAKRYYNMCGTYVYAKERLEALKCNGLDVYEC